MTLVAFTTEHIRDWHKRGTLSYIIDRKWDYAFRRYPVIPNLIRRWTEGDQLDELTEDLVDWLLCFAETRGDPGERWRAQKLILDAARELYMIPAFQEAGGVRYSQENDLAGVDFGLDIDGHWIPVQVACRLSPLSADLDGIKHRRLRRRGGIGAKYQLTFDNIEDVDTTCQPWVPTHTAIRQAVEALRDLVDPSQPEQRRLAL